MRQSKAGKRTPVVLLILILCLQTLFMLRYCNIKSGYFVDELWSYGLANSYYHAQIWEDGALDTTEIDPKMFEDYLVVNEGEEFTYDSVIYNQTHDSHPPLFYIVLHTISSFFPGEFSKWFGLLPNLVYFIISIVFLYKIAGLFTKDRLFPLVPVLMYGFSIAAVNSVTYIRMYMMLTMWCLMFAYFHLKTAIKERMTWKDLLLLGISTLGGVLTQYYFVIFACPWVLLYIVWLWKKKDGKEFIKYAGAGIIGCGIAVACYPAAVFNVTGSNAGHSASTFANLRDFSDWGENISTFLQQISSQMFGSMFWIVIGCCILAAALYVVTHVLWKVSLKRADGNEICRISVETNTQKQIWIWKMKREHIAAVMTGLATLFYFVIVAKISPWQSERYMTPILPLIVLLFCLFAYWVFKLWGVRGRKRFLTMVLVVAVIGGLTYFGEDPEYLYEDAGSHIAVSEEYSDVSCVYIYTTSYIMINNALELQNYEHLYQMYYGDIAEKMKAVAINGSELIVYADVVMDREEDEDGNRVLFPISECLKQVEEISGLQNSELLFTDEKVEVYRLYNE